MENKYILNYDRFKFESGHSVQTEMVLWDSFNLIGLLAILCIYLFDRDSNRRKNMGLQQQC